MLKCNHSIGEGAAPVDERRIPDEILLLWQKSEAAIVMMDVYARLPFGYRKALRSGTDSIQFKTEFWSKLMDLYPDLGHGLTANMERKVVWKLRPEVGKEEK